MKLTTYGTITAGALVVALWIGGCAATLDIGKSDTVRVTAGYAFDAYASLYQPLLKAYSSLPYCQPAKAPCKDRALYRKLYDLDGAVVECADAAQKSIASPNPDLAAISACMHKVEDAKFAFAQAGVRTTP